MCVRDSAAMDTHRIRRRDHGRRRVTNLTKLISAMAAAGALVISVAAARSNPGKPTTPPATVRGNAGVIGHRHLQDKAGGTQAPQTSSPPVIVAQPPVTTTGGS